MTWSRFDIIATIVVILSCTQFFLSVEIAKITKFEFVQLSNCVVCGVGVVLIVGATLLQKENDHRHVYERRILLLLFYGITILRFLVYGCERPCEVCMPIGLARLIIAYVEAFLAIPIYVLAIRQRSRTPDAEMPPIDDVEESLPTVPLGSHKNE